MKYLPRYMFATVTTVFIVGIVLCWLSVITTEQLDSATKILEFLVKGALLIG